MYALNSNKWKLWSASKWNVLKMVRFLLCCCYGVYRLLYGILQWYKSLYMNEHSRNVIQINKTKSLLSNTFDSVLWTFLWRFQWKCWILYFVDLFRKQFERPGYPLTKDGEKITGIQRSCYNIYRSQLK